jgi:cytochrome c1
MSALKHESECPVPTSAAPYSVERAKATLRQYACHDCHRISDVVGPRTHVGPTLQDWSRRKFIAGRFPNTPANLVRWILAPQELSPGTLNVHATEAHARDMARYLFETR